MTRKPGDSLQVVYERRGERVTAMLKLVEDPRSRARASRGGGAAVVGCAEEVSGCMAQVCRPPDAVS